MIIGYACTFNSTYDLQVQIDALIHAGCEQIFSESISSIISERVKLADVLEYVGEDDTIVISKLNVLGGSLRHLIKTINVLREKNIVLKSLHEQIDTANNDTIFFRIFKVLDEFEQELIQENQRLGLLTAQCYPI